ADWLSAEIAKANAVGFADPGLRRLSNRESARCGERVFLSLFDLGAAGLPTAVSLNRPHGLGIGRRQRLPRFKRDSGGFDLITIFQMMGEQSPLGAHVVRMGLEGFLKSIQKTLVRGSIAELSELVPITRVR